MTKKQKINRKQKWRNITLNKANIDEYLQDLYNDTSGNYITQGVSFNKDDNFQMSLLRNALIAHGSFSGFVKTLLHAHFDKHGKLDDTIWQPNEIIEEELEDDKPSSSSPALLVEKDDNDDTTSYNDDNEEKTKEDDIAQEHTTKEELKSKPPEKKQDKKRTPRETNQSNGVSKAQRASNYSL